MGSANQKAEITAAGSWPATQGLKTEFSEKAAETLCGSHGQDVCFPSPPGDGTSTSTFPSQGQAGTFVQN